MHQPIRSPGKDLRSEGFKLDRETEALLYWASSSTSSPLWHLSPGAARNDYRRGLAKTEIVPPEVGETSDFDVSSDAGALRLRKYIPADPNIDAEAAILFVHGGGCVIGDLETHDVFCRALCHDTRATVLSLDYRLAPEHPFPAAVEDTVAALGWLSHEARALGLDPARIAVAGDSAGGGLAAVALHETKGKLAAPVRGQALIYPALDLRGRLPSRKELADHFPIPSGHDPMVLQPLFRPRLAHDRSAGDSCALRGLCRPAAGPDCHRRARPVARRGRRICRDP